MTQATTPAAKRTLEPAFAKPSSLAGTPAAGPRDYPSWALGQGARDAYYILVVIYIFYPYFSNTVVGDPVVGPNMQRKENYVWSNFHLTNT